MLSALPCLAQTKRPIKQTDIYDFEWLANPEISPDGSQIVYTRVVVTPKHDNYETALWIVSSTGGSPRQLTTGPHDSAPRWSPDGKTLAFSRTVEVAGKPPSPQIFLLSMQGGEARLLTDMPKGAASVVWSPDGKFIAFTSTTKAADFEKKEPPPEPESDVRIITRALYRENGEGYAELARPSHIWIAGVPAPLTTPVQAKQITTGQFEEGDVLWSRDGSKLYFTSDRVLEPYYQSPDTDLYVVSAAGGDISRIAHIAGTIGQLALNPDGTRLAFVGTLNGGEGVDERSYSQPDLFVTRLEPNSTPVNLTAKFDFDIAGTVGGDQAPPRGNAPALPWWSRDGKSVFISVSEEGKVNLKRIQADTGEVKAVTEGNHNIYSYSASADGSKAAIMISTPTQIGDLYLVDSATGRTQPVVQSNAGLFASLKLTEPEMIWYKSFDGKRIQAWVQRPPDFVEGRKYPVILDIHGGPHSAYGYTFDHEFQWMAAKGYIVLYPNPRGSTSYGQDFGNVIQYHYPGDDYKDLMAGVDELVSRGWADPEKLGVTGGSGGGVLTNWTVGHTNRFKAAVSQRSIADWRDFWFTADFTLFTPFWFRGAPWEQEADFKERSPITYIDKMNTPLMLIEGESDLRTPPGSGGEQMFRALKYRKIPTVMVRFPGESHELSRSGKPAHRVARLENILAWFDKYLQGQDIHTYDVQ
jgi:dipeptidyl aminopeptidase/acylaminoacyl peptidase